MGDTSTFRGSTRGPASWISSPLISAAPVAANLDTALLNGRPDACFNNFLGADQNNNGAADDFDSDGTPDPAESHDDWSNITLAFRNSPKFARVPAGDQEAPIDATLDEIDQTMFLSRTTDVSVENTNDNSVQPILSDGSVAISLDVVNNGPVPAFGPVTVTFGVPAGTEVSAASGLCEDADATTVTCVLGAINAWGSAHLDIELSVPPCSTGSAVSIFAENPAGLDLYPDNNGVWLRLEQGGPWPMRGLCSARTSRSGYNLSTNNGTEKWRVVLASGLSDDVDAS